MDLVDFPGMEDIFENMCRGIRRSGRNGNEMLLEYIGKGNPGKRASNNRKAAGCKGRNRLNCVAMFGKGSSCDEWPPATSIQGGASAAIRCVPGTDNSAMGGKWSGKITGKDPGTMVRQKIKGMDCSKVSMDFDPRKTTSVRLLKRAVGGAILLNTTDAVYVDGEALYGTLAGGRVAILVPIVVPGDFVGELTYSFTITTGTLRSAVLLDDGGDEYGVYVPSPRH